LRTALQKNKNNEGEFIMINKFKGLFIEEQGQGMTEYGLILGLVAVAVIGALVLLGDNIFEMINDLAARVTGTD
jgi:pilus assembly protein Flp/PilA